MSEKFNCDDLINLYNENSKEGLCLVFHILGYMKVVRCLRELEIKENLKDIIDEVGYYKFNHILYELKEEYMNNKEGE